MEILPDESVTAAALAELCFDIFVNGVEKYRWKINESNNLWVCRTSTTGKNGFT